MQPFDTLSKRGKAGRLRRVALQALEQYDLDLRRVRLVGMFTNALFRADSVSGPSYLVRVCQPNWRTPDDLRSEGMWLSALSCDPATGAPAPLLSRAGEYVVETHVPGAPEPQRCVVMSWIPGRLLARQMSAANLAKMGALFARLHEQAAGFTPPPGFTTRKMDSIYARGEADVLFADPQRDAFDPRSRAIFERVSQMVTDSFARLYGDPRGLRVIHNDLHHENINLYRGRLYPLDFEDTVWGYPVQDIAMALQDLMLGVKPELFEPLRRAFQAGYESGCPWPEREPGQVDILRAGRMLWVANYVARCERQYLKQHLQWNAPIFERFLESGKLTLAG